MTASPGSTGVAYDLYCTSCHDAHGSANYRMIKTTVNGVAVTLADADSAAKSYTATHYYAGTTQWSISTFCAACHTRYQVTTSASGETSSTDYIFTYRHREDAPSGAVVNGITYTFPTTIALPMSSTDGAAPVASPTDNRSMVCLTCHYAHGSKAAMGTNSAGETAPSSASCQRSRASKLRCWPSASCWGW